MLEPKEIVEIRKKYGPIFSTEIKGQTVFFRELTFSEFDDIIAYQDLDGGSSIDSEDSIITTAVVYPENFNVDKLPAGIVSTLATQILDISGFNSAKTAKNILEEKRAESGQVRTLMKAFVLATISTYKPEDLDNMTYSQLADKVALSEKIIEITQAMHSIQPNELKLQLIDPEEEVDKAKQSAARHNASKLEGAADYEDPIAQKLWGMK